MAHSRPVMLQQMAHFSISVRMNGRCWSPNGQIDIIDIIDSLARQMRLGTRPGWHMSCEASRNLKASQSICTSFRYVISELDWMREFIEGVSMEAAGRQDSG